MMEFLYNGNYKNNDRNKIIECHNSSLLKLLYLNLLIIGEKNILFNSKWAWYTKINE